MLISLHNLKGCWLETVWYMERWETWVLTWVLPSTHCVTSTKSLSSGAQFSHLSNGEARLDALSPDFKLLSGGKILVLGGFWGEMLRNV